MVLPSDVATYNNTSIDLKLNDEYVLLILAIGQFLHIFSSSITFTCNDTDYKVIILIIFKADGLNLRLSVIEYYF